MPPTDCNTELDAIMASVTPDMDKLSQAFDCITRFVIGNAEREVELARAMHDREAMVKTQIKMETLKHARVIFETCYLRVNGRKPWSNEEEAR